MRAIWRPLRNPDHTVIDLTGQNNFSEKNLKNLKVIQGKKKVMQLINDEIDLNPDLDIATKATIRNRWISEEAKLR